MGTFLFNKRKTILETISKDIFLSKAEEVVIMGDYNINLSEYSVKVGGLSTYACVIITYEWGWSKKWSEQH